MMTGTRDLLLDLAATRVQTRGYNGFSFNDLARDAGIKAASIHYHFPTKADLGQTLAERYRKGFAATIGAAGDGTPSDALGRFVAAFAATLDQGRMCLCGLMGAEVRDLPDSVAIEVAAFFTFCQQWLEAVFTRAKAGDAATSARHTMAALEGALMMAQVARDPRIFHDVAAEVRRAIG